MNTFDTVCSVKKEMNRTIVLQQLLTLFVQLIVLINQSAVV